MAETLTLLFENRSKRSGTMSLYVTPPQETPSRTAVATESQVVHPQTTVLLTWQHRTRDENAQAVCWLIFDSETLQIPYPPGVSSMTAVLDDYGQWNIGPRAANGAIVNDHDRHM